MGCLVEKGAGVETGGVKLENGLLRRDRNGNSPKFLSSIRSYLGKVAEQRLDYNCWTSIF